MLFYFFISGKTCTIPCSVGIKYFLKIYFSMYYPAKKKILKKLQYKKVRLHRCPKIVHHKMSLFNTECYFLSHSPSPFTCLCGRYSILKVIQKIWTFRYFFFSFCKSSGEFPICIRSVMTTHFCPRACVTWEITARYQNPMLRTSISKSLQLLKWDVEPNSIST